MGVNPQELQLMLRLGRLGAGNSPLGQDIGELSSGLGAYEGFRQGNVLGDISGVANLAKLGQQTGALGSLAGADAAKEIGQGAGGALDALQMYEGIKRGGWEGYGSAVGAGLQGAGELLANTALSQAGGAILAPIDTYEAIKNWQSGATGSDALQGAEAGAAWGTLVLPGIGTLIGAGIGAGVGALSSAFGGGRPDLETGGWNQFAKAYNQATPEQQAAAMPNLDPAQAYQNLAGVMDAKNNTPGHSQSIEQVFGRMGEQNMMDQMTNEINKAYQSGQITSGESMQDQWNKVINPWLQSKGVTWDPTQRTSTGQLETPALQGDIQSLLGSWETGNVTGKSPMGIAGQPISGLQSFKGMPGMVAAANPATPVTSWVGGTGTTGPQQGSFAGSQTMPAGTMMYNPTPTAGAPQMEQAESFGLHAEGGLMKRSKRQAMMDQIRRAPPIYRRHFDDGGGTDDFSEEDLNAISQAGADYSAQNPNVFSSASSLSSPSSGGGGGGGQSWGKIVSEDPSGMVTYENGNQYDPETGYYTIGNKIYDPDGNVISSGDKTHSIMGDLKAAGRGLTGQEGLGTMLKDVAALSPLAALFIKPKTNLNPPGPVPGMTQGAKSPNAPIGPGRTQVGAPGGLSSTQLTSGTAGITPQIGAAGSPSNLPGGAPMSLADWYTYGSRPEASFFQNNQVPLAQATGVSPPPTGQAQGGALRHIHHEPGTDESVMLPEFDSAFEHHAEGPGDGTSDNIPAQLSDGEYVMDANTVSLLGNGSNKAGAARLDQLRENIRRHAAGSMSRGKQFMKAKPPEAYLGMGRGRRR